MTSSVNESMISMVDELNNDFVSELYTKLPKGKMLRSRLLKLIAPDHKDVDRVAAIIEMIHLSSLLHDDVIDEADTRRGQASINALFSDKHAVMLGDIFYSKAFFELTKLPTDISQSISAAVTKLSLGELQDVELAKSFNEDIEAYYEMIYLKTSALIEATTECGAYMAGLDPQDYRLFGKNLGVAFQIVDDLLDITQDAQTLGKPAFNDLSEGKVTLPIHYFYEVANSEDRAILKSFFLKRLNLEEQVWLREKVLSSGSLERTKLEVQRLVDEAKAVVLDKPELLVLLSKMVERSF
jgi:octaprenyl-diphosphate synthase